MHVFSGRFSSPKLSLYELTMIINSFSFHRVHVGIVRVLNPENSIDAVAAADATFSAID